MRTRSDCDAGLPQFAQIGGYDSYSIGEARVPYCHPCILEHRREPHRLPALRRLIACFNSGVIFAALGSGLLALLLFKEAIQSFETHPAGAHALFAFGSVMALIAWGCYRVAHRETEPFAIPAQSQITMAFDFSDNLSDSFQPDRRIYAMRNERFAKQFRELNGDALWDPHGPAVRKADRTFWICVAIAIAFGFLMWLLGIG